MNYHIKFDSEEAYGEVFVAFLRDRLLIWALAVLEEGKVGLTKKGKGKDCGSRKLGRDRPEGPDPLLQGEIYT